MNNKRNGRGERTLRIDGYLIFLSKVSAYNSHLTSIRGVRRTSASAKCLNHIRIYNATVLDCCPSFVLAPTCRCFSACLCMCSSKRKRKACETYNAKKQLFYPPEEQKSFIKIDGTQGKICRTHSKEEDNDVVFFL